MATIINVDGTVVGVFPKNGKTFTLDEMLALIGGGWLEAVPYTAKSVMYVDEEGLSKELPLNRTASCMLTIQRKAITAVYGVVLIASLKETGDE